MQTHVLPQADIEAGSEQRHYAGYEQWKGWEQPLTFTAEDAEYFAGKMRAIPLAGRTLLEVGFGAGSFLAWARQAGAVVAGTEINPVLVEAAQKADVEIFPPDLEAIAAANPARFDIVVAFDVFEHFTLDEVDARLRAVEAMLRPGGDFVLRFPNGQSPFGLAPQNADVTHQTALSKEKIEQLCLKLPLRSLRYAGSYRVRGPLGLKRVARRLRYIARDLIAATLNLVYASDIPWDAVVVLVMRKEAEPARA